MPNVYQIGIALPPGFVGIIRWIEKHRPELNAGRCPAQPDGRVRAVITVTLPSPDVGGEFAATLIKQAAEESGYTGQLPLRVELWPASDNPPHDFEGAGSVAPGTVGNRIASFVIRFEQSREPIKLVVLDSGEGSCIHVAEGTAAVLGPVELEVGGQRMPFSLCIACSLIPPGAPAKKAQ